MKTVVDGREFVFRSWHELGDEERSTIAPLGMFYDVLAVVDLDRERSRAEVPEGFMAVGFFATEGTPSARIVRGDRVLLLATPPSAWELYMMPDPVISPFTAELVQSGRMSLVLVNMYMLHSRIMSSVASYTLFRRSWH